jgi:S-DNA-T family DNA segregation ATPase FtsK/SpoIIIE
VTTTTKRRPPAKRGGASASGRRPPARRRPAQRPPTLAGHVGHGIKTGAAALARQEREFWGVVLVGLGVLLGLGIYANWTGLFGRAVRAGTGDLVGWGRLLVPAALVVVGITMIRTRREKPASGRKAAEKAPHDGGAVRVAFGFTLLLVAVSGLFHVVAGAPPLHSPIAVLRDGGGLIGGLIGGPLAAVLASIGAGFVLVILIALALLVITGTSIRTAIDAVTMACVAIGKAARSFSQWLVTLSSQRRGGAPGVEDDDDVEPFDEPVDEVPAKPKRTRKPAEPKPEIHVPEEPVPAGQQLAIDLGPAAEPGVWKLPPMSMLKLSENREVDRRMVEEAGRVLEDALAAHGVQTRLVGMTVGPTVTRYELELGTGVKVNKVTSLNKDIAYAMASPDVRILAPIPGRSAIGVEVPNRQRQLVALGDILTSEEARRAVHPLEVGVGRDIAGRPVMENLASMPHVLIAGATGAGKSSCINSILTSLLMRATPDQVRMILVDPKRVELGVYNGLPHLLTQVVINPKKAANALSWAVHEMERRSDLLAEVGVRDITGYNNAYDRGELKAGPGEDKEYERLPFIVVVVDELNDLMMVAARDVEESICRIAQMGRAFGIHLVIATQRPSVDVITGVIKANVPSRLAFMVSSLADSRVILDQPGAERLVGKGDMLLLGASSNVPRRIQGPWVGEDEVKKVVGHWRRQAQEPQYVEGVEGDDITGGPVGGGPGGGDDDNDDMLEQAMELVVRSQLGSTSMLQRKLRVGFARAGRIMDLLEQRGVVGPSEGSKPRQVLMTPEELDERLSNRV